MYCLKCGRETVSEKVFCNECLELMKQHPVKPGTAIQLPQRASMAVPKKAPKRVLSPEEQIVRLKRSRFWLRLTVILLFVCLCGTLLYMQTRLRSKTDAATPTTIAPVTEATTQATTESATTNETQDVSRETTGN